MKLFLKVHENMSFFVKHAIIGFIPLAMCVVGQYGSAIVIGLSKLQETLRVRNSIFSQDTQPIRTLSDIVHPNDKLARLPEHMKNE